MCVAKHVVNTFITPKMVISSFESSSKGILLENNDAFIINFSDEEECQSLKSIQTWRGIECKEAKAVMTSN